MITTTSLSNKIIWQMSNMSNIQSMNCQASNSWGVGGGGGDTVTY